MKVRIPSLPPRASAAYDRYLDWINEPVWRRVRRIDVLLALAGMFCLAWYGYHSDPWWHGALIGGGMYLLLLMIGLWFF